MSGKRTVITESCARWGGQILIFGDHLNRMLRMHRLAHSSTRSQMQQRSRCRNLVKKTKVPTYLPLPEGKKLRRKSKVSTYLPLWKGKKVHQNSKVPNYLPI